MGSLSRGQTFGATETITNTKLHNLVDLGSVSGIVNADIAPAAAIAYSKLNLALSILNADISASAAIAYSKLALTGSILNADLAGSIADSKLSQITTASKVSGTAITGLASLPSAAGVVPIANLATGTPSGSKFVRDDNTLAAPSFTDVAGSYATGTYLVAGPSAVVQQNSTGAMTKIVEMRVPRGGTLKVTFGLVRVSTSTTDARIYRNGSAVGTARSNATTTWVEYTEDISGWTAGDLLQLYADDSGGTDGSIAGALRVFENTPNRETFGTGGIGMGAGPVQYAGNLAAPGALGQVGDTYINTSGGAGTMLYYKTGATTWTAA
jgi:hypothetical protein